MTKKRIGVTIALFILMTACSTVATLSQDGFDRKLRSFKFAQPTRKLSLGLIYYNDSRAEKTEYYFDGNKPLRQFATKLTEEMLVKQGGFSSVTVITALDVPESGGAIDFEKLKKAYGFDYILKCDITEAKLQRVELPSSLSYKLSIYLNLGIWPDQYEYRSRVRLHGKLVSLADGSAAWEGEGSSSFQQVRRQNSENVLMSALYNSVGSMLSDMSKIFSLQIKEVK